MLENSVENMMLNFENGFRIYLKEILCKGRLRLNEFCGVYSFSKVGPRCKVVISYKLTYDD